MTPSEHIFDIHPWSLQESDIKAEHLTLAETLFSLANGYIGTRGTFEESIADNETSCEGTYLNGVYVRDPIHYEEVAHAFATHNDKMVQVPDAKAIRLYIDGQLFVPSTFSSASHERTLDFREGVLKRTTHWNLGDDKALKISSKRIVSYNEQHLMAIEYSVTPVGFDAHIRLDSLLGIRHLITHDKDAVDPRAGHLSPEDSLRVIEAKGDDTMMRFLHEVEGSGFIIGSSVRHSCSHDSASFQETDEAPCNQLVTSFEADLKDGKAITLTKYISYFHADRGEDADVIANLDTTLQEAERSGFEHAVAGQKEQLQEFWNKADVTIAGDDPLQQGIRFNLFHTFQSSGKDGKRAIGAKGISGPGYDGHYFWDTEIYIIPYFVYSAPEIARKLLEFRYSILDKSRDRAKQMSHTKGALYAWRTIGGEECSAYFPAGTAQYHINAAIAYAILQYHQATQDWDFMQNFGAEMLLETARIWSDIGHFSEHKNGAFCINEVTGPDEYSAMVDNNFYTNAMAQMHLRGAVSILKALQEKDAPAARKLIEKINLDDTEITRWEAAAEHMYLPTDNALQINPQDDGFLGKPKWDFANTPKEKHPLLLHFHPLVIHRHQVLKQADVVLAMALLGRAFDRKTRTNNLEYYMPLTTHDSTLSTCIYSVECSRAGKYDQAYRFFEDTARMDIDNLHHNTEYGLHTACMAGSWISIVMGFGGMEVHDNTLHFAPHLPKKWQNFSFNVAFQGSAINVNISTDAVTYSLTNGETVNITHFDQPITLKSDTPYIAQHVQEKQYA